MGKNKKKKCSNCAHHERTKGNGPNFCHSDPKDVVTTASKLTNANGATKDKVCPDWERKVVSAT